MWTLDTILILLYDDCMAPYFGLQHLPGFLETLSCLGISSPTLRFICATIKKFLPRTNKCLQ